MTNILKKIDSNVTGLRYAEEASLGVLPGSPVWKPMEPNSYSNFGGQLTTVARQPINDGRQRRKGNVVDLSAGGSVNTDLTQSGLQDLLQGFFFADMRRKFEAVATAVTLGPNKYDFASTTGIVTGSLLFASGFTSALNTGLKTVTAFDGTTVTVAETTVANASPPATNLVVRVGHKFSASELDIDASGVLPVLVGHSVAATDDFTFVGNPANNDEVQVGGVTYTFKTVLTGAANEVKIGAADSDTATNLAAAINASAGAGTLYGTGTVANPLVKASLVGLVLTATARQAGADGDTISATTPVGTGGAWATATLTGGVGAGFTRLGLIPGEWIFLGGDGAGKVFTNVANIGFARIKAITDDQHMTLDKTQTAFVTEVGTGLTVEMFFGRVLKNEANQTTLIKRRTYHIERSLGVPDTDLPNDVQAEYLIGAVPGMLKFSFKTAALINVDLDFVGIDNTQRLNTDGLLGGTRPTLISTDAYNTSSDFARLKMAILDPATSNPTPLFAFLSDFSVTLDNKLDPNKAISKLGAFEVSAGFFTVDATGTAYFSEVSAIQAVRNNADVTIDYALVKNETVDANTVAQGIVMDIPLVALGDGRLNVAINKPIDLNLTIAAAGDRIFNHTLLVSFYDYLPQVALPA